MASVVINLFEDCEFHNLWNKKPLGGKAGFREVCSIFCYSPKAWQKKEFYNFPSLFSTKKCFNNDVGDTVIPSKGDFPP
jgi:hypothetical protein